MHIRRAEHLRFPIYYRVQTSVRLTSVGELYFDTEQLASNLYIPWAMDISNDGTIYFTTRPGSIRIIKNKRLLEEALITLETPFVSQGEGGLLGIALDPDFATNHHIYIMYSFEENSILYNRVVRLVEENNKAVIDKILVDYIPGGRIHNGGRLKIGPDGKLYITTGDTGNPELAQDITSLAGKILRIELDGSIPDDNPFEESLVYSYGHRNPQGLAWNTRNNIMYASEHGQTAHDEINIIVPGGNYGWPIIQGDEESANMIEPIIHSGNETWAPSGMAYLDGEVWDNKLFVAGLRSKQLLIFSLNEDGTFVTNVDTLFQDEYGRLRDVYYAKDGSIYILTNNRDGRGSPNLSIDDRIIRIIPSWN